MSRRSPFCILFAGPAGCSKTPVAYYLSWNLNLPIFNNDAIRTEVREDTLCSELNGKLYLQRKNKRLEKILSLQVDFIYDASIDRDWLEIKEKLKRHNYYWFIISYNLSKKFIKEMAKAKKYQASKELTDKWYNDHQKFLLNHGEEVDFVISDRNFPSRLKDSLQAVKLFLSKKDLTESS